jgi:hypothetical protein
MKDNLLYNGGEDERSVVNNIRNALNRLSSEARANFFHELAGVSVSAPIEREHSTAIETPDNTVLIGLAGDPAPVSLGDLSERSGGGPVDLYAEEIDEAIAIEAKLGHSGSVEILFFRHIHR